MKMRLIDADEVQKRIDLIGTVNGILCWDAHDFIDRIPTIEVEPVRHGCWIPISDTAAKCSVCGWWQKTNGHDETGNAHIHKAVYKYCTACGARMDGEMYATSATKKSHSISGS